MDKKTAIIAAAIIISLIIVAALRENNPHKYSNSDSEDGYVLPKDTTTSNTDFTPADKSWIYGGAIYETHPYYYPKHSFKEITEQVPSLVDLGVKTIYLMPVWEQPPGERSYSLIYHIYDYYKINPDYGTPQELKELINAAHKAGINVVFDLVTCCTWKGTAVWEMNGTFSMPLSELQKKAKENGWVLEYETVDKNNYVKYNCSLRNGKRFCGFGGLIMGDAVMPLQYPLVGWGFAVDKAKPEVIKYFTDITTYYVKEYDIDGWRVDAPSNNWNSEIISGDHSSQELLKNVKNEITKIKPSAVLVSEWPTIAVMEPSDNPKTSELDEENEASYSYYFYSKISEIVNGKNPLDVIASETISYNRTRVRFLESHDTYQRINSAASQLNNPLTVLIATLPGIPMIQAGQEIGATNEYFTNPEVNWASGDNELKKFYNAVFSIRSSSSALRYGGIKNVWKSGDDTYAYSRSYENETVIAIINFKNKDASIVLNLPFESGAVLQDKLSGERFGVEDPSNFRIIVPERGSRILAASND